jgi:hypothetical protein
LTFEELNKRKENKECSKCGRKENKAEILYKLNDNKINIYSKDVKIEDTVKKYPKLNTMELNIKEENDLNATSQRYNEEYRNNLNDITEKEETCDSEIDIMCMSSIQKNTYKKNWNLHHKNSKM